MTVIPSTKQTKPKTTSNRQKKGLCLAGGGITGAMYEVGVLAAFEDVLEDFSVCDFDLFVGAASGAPVATALAAGISAGRMYRALLDPADDFFPLKRHHLLRFDRREFRRVSASIIGSFRRTFGSVIFNPLKLDLWEELDRFYDSLPAGLFSTETFEEFFSGVLMRRGISEEFSGLDKELLLIANDLDAGERCIFGPNHIDNVPIAKAVCASIATPLLFAPVRIGDRDYIAGGVGEAGHVDVAVEHGCNWVLAINAMVPIRTGSGQVPTGSGQRNRVRDKGMLWVYNQSWRMVTEARLQTGLTNYRAEHKDVSVYLIEPEKDDAIMFMYSPMNFSARRMILEDGYRATVKQIRNPESELRRALDDLGLNLKPRLEGL